MEQQTETTGQKTTKKKKKQVQLTTSSVNWAILLYGIPLALGIDLLFWFIYGSESFTMGWDEFKTQFFLMMVIMFFLHDGIRVLVWGNYAKEGMRSIKYGFNFTELVVYGDCTEPLKLWQYRLGLIMPSMLLGIVPIVYGFIMKDAFWVFFGAMDLSAATGDWMMVSKLRGMKRDAMIQDLPGDCGFEVADVES